MKKKNNHKYTSILILIIIAITALFAYKEYSNYNISKDTYKNIVDISANEINKYTETIFQEEEQYSKYVMGQLSKSIQSELKTQYVDEQEFINDIENPNSNTKLSNILDSCSSEYVQSGNDIVITSDDKVLYTNKPIIKKDDVITLDDIKNGFTNKKLTSQAIKNIITPNKNKNFIFWDHTTDTHDENISIESMDISKLSDIIYSGNTNELKKYELLVPVYITDDGDILGNSDINSMGGHNKTYKIIIIHRINIYNILGKYDSNYMYLHTKTEYLKQSIEREFKYTISVLVLSVIFIVILIFGSRYIQNKVLKNNE